MCARPFTRPDSAASSTDPLIEAPAGTAVSPEMTTAWATDPLTGSSTLLVFEASGLSTLTLIEVPAGMVTSRSFGAAEADGSFGAAAADGAAFDFASGTAALAS